MRRRIARESPQAVGKDSLAAHARVDLEMNGERFRRSAGGARCGFQLIELPLSPTRRA